MSDLKGGDGQKDSMGDANMGDHSALLGELESLTKDPKSTADFSKETAALIGEADSLVAAKRLDDALTLIEPLEKKARQSFDTSSVARLCVWCLKATMEAGQLERAQELLVTQTRRRGQLKGAIVEMVRHMMEWLDKLPKREQVLSLIETLSTVTEGKIFVEVERARIILRLAKMKEAEGDIATASSLLQEVHIETSIAMEKHEKANFILEQMRMVLLREDYIRCQIVSKRINRKLIEADDFQLIKLQYYGYMLQYHLYLGEIMPACMCFKACLDTPIIRACKERPEAIDMTLLKPFLPAGLAADSLSQWFLESVVLLCLLAPQTPEQQDLMRRLRDTEKKGLQASPAFYEMLESFLTQDIVRYPPPYTESILQHSLMTDSPWPKGAERKKLYKDRVDQHNLTVMSQYYTCCSLKRMSELLGISVDEVEEQLCNLVSSGLVKAKINRPSGIVHFGAKRDTMADWSRSISSLLDVLEEAGHLLEKEKLMQAALTRGK